MSDRQVNADELSESASDVEALSKSASDAVSLSKSATSHVALPKSVALPDWAHRVAPADEAERLEVGRELLAIKATMRGGFKEWVQATCTFSYRAAARWMQAAKLADVEQARQARRQSNAMPEYAPTRFAESTMTVPEMLELVCIMTQGLSAEMADGKLTVGLPRLAGAFGFSIAAAPHITYGDLLDAAARARLLLTAVVMEINAIEEIASAFPENGIVSSSPQADASMSAEGGDDELA